MELYKLPCVIESITLKIRSGNNEKSDFENFLPGDSPQSFQKTSTKTDPNVLSRAGDSIGEDAYGLRDEFLDLVQRYGRIINY